MSISHPRTDFPLERFLECFREALLLRALSPPPVLERFLCKFWFERYPDDVKRFSSQRRFLAFAAFFEEHRADLAAEGFLQSSNADIEISPHLQIALYLAFWSQPLEHLDSISLNNVLDLTDEQRRTKQDDDRD